MSTGFVAGFGVGVGAGVGVGVTAAGAGGPTTAALAAEVEVASPLASRARSVHTTWRPASASLSV